MRRSPGNNGVSEGREERKQQKKTEDGKKINKQAIGNRREIRGGKRSAEKSRINEEEEEGKERKGKERKGKERKGKEKRE